jgi:hypothetical protein
VCIALGESGEDQLTRLGCRGDLAEHRLVVGLESRDDLGEQIFLRGEVPEEAGVADGCGCGDVAQRGRAVAAGDEQVMRGGEDALPCRRGAIMP